MNIVSDPFSTFSAGYVPQDIYLTDSSIASNIAYGLTLEDIDLRAVERAARIANIHDFITTKLPSGYDTIVGERGVRLSGGAAATHRYRASFISRSCCYCSR